MDRTIIHADMDAFFASVEQRDRPELQGKAVVVGGAAPRGVVAAASYEARRYGIHSAMPMVKALRRFPRLVVVSPRMGRYSEVSRRVFEIFRSYSPLVEGLSVDEAFIDISGTEKLHGSALEVAKTIKERVRQELSLVVSIGIAPNKFLAKVASDLEKPDGLVIVDSQGVQEFLDPLPIRRLFGVGRVTEAQLTTLGVKTIGQLAALEESLLISRCGASSGSHLYRLARGQDDRPVESERLPKSIGHEDTFIEDTDDMQKLERIVRQQADEVAYRLRAKGFVAKTLVLKLKTAHFITHSRQKKLPRATDDGRALGDVGVPLLRALMRRIGSEKVRLTGLSATDLMPPDAPRQLSLDEPAHQKGETLARTLDQITERFGRSAIHRGQIPTHGLRNRNPDGPNEGAIAEDEGPGVGSAGKSGPRSDRNPLGSAAAPEDHESYG